MKIVEQNIKQCWFCSSYDFGNAMCDNTLSYVGIAIAGGSGRFEEHEQFKYCPECGRRLGTYKEKYQKGR